MIGELRDIARVLEDYSDGFNSMALYELAQRVEAVADGLEAEEAAAAKFVAEKTAADEPRCTKGNVLAWHTQPCEPGCNYPTPATEETP